MMATRAALALGMVLSVANAHLSRLPGRFSNPHLAASSQSRAAPCFFRSLGELQLQVCKHSIANQFRASRRQEHVVVQHEVPVEWHIIRHQRPPGKRMKQRGPRPWQVVVATPEHRRSALAVSDCSRRAPSRPHDRRWTSVDTSPTTRSTSSATVRAKPLSFQCNLTPTMLSRLPAG